MEIKEGYKKTEIGVIPIDWVEHNLIEKSTLKARIGWQGLTTKEYLNSGDYYLITGTDFLDGKIMWDNCNYVEKVRYSQDRNIQIKISDILITKDGTIGKVAFINSLPLPATLNSGVFVVRPKEAAYSPLYVFYIFNSKYFAEFLRKLVAGSTINHLYQKDFVSFKFPLPPSPEQQAIAQVLSDTDTLIQTIEKQVAKKRLIKQGIMQKLLSPKEEWVVKKFGDIFEICGGYSATREQLSNDGYCYLHYGDIHGSKKTFIDCSIDFSDIPKLKIGLNKVSRKSLLINGDVVFVDASEDDEGTSRHVVIRNGKNIPFISGLHTIVARSKDESLDLRFKSYCFQCKYIKDQFKFFAVGTKVSGVSKTSIKNIKIYIPPKSEQKNIANTLECMDIEIEHLEDKVSKYKLLRQGLMQNLLTGKIRLKQS